MTSFTKQLRMGLRTARENIDAEPAPMDAAQVEATLAEPVGAEIEQDVVGPAQEIEQGAGALVEASTDADTLESTAQILEGALGEAEPDVDVATSELANITVEAIARKYNLPRGVKLSKESFGTADARKDIARQISKEAMEKVGELRKRVSEGLVKLIEWFKNLIKSVFDKRTKLDKRLQAITALAQQRKGQKVKEGAKISGHADAVDFSWVDLQKPIDNLAVVKDIAQSDTTTAGDRELTDLNEKLLGGVKLTVSITDGKVNVVKEKVANRATVELDVKSIDDIVLDAKYLRHVLDKLKKAEADFNKIVEAMGTTAQKLKTVATGKEGGEQIDRAKILARYQAVSTIGGTLSAIVLSVIAEAATALEQSLAAYEAPAAA